MTADIRLADEIFFALATIPAEDREAFLQERCGGNASLRADVDALLAALDAPDEGFLDPAKMPSLDLGAVDGPLQPGTTLSGYLVLHAIGSGGMGVVYAAQQDHPRRTVAIKVLRRTVRHPEVMKRFAREAEVLAHLRHPGIAQVFAFHPGDGAIPAHLVMELVSGPPITEYVAAHQLDESARLTLMIAICDAMQHAHDRGVVHRDLKPANVLVTSDGAPKILDFGIARAAGLDFLSTLQTSHGQLLGTVAYMSPEQLRGAVDEVDHRSDIYALGVMLHRIISGKVPLEAGGPLLTGPTAQVAARAMAPERLRRYGSAAEMATDLRACRDGSALGAQTIASDVARIVMAIQSADGRYVAIALPHSKVIVLDASTGRHVAESAVEGSSVERLEFEPGQLTIRSTGGTTYLALPD